MRQFLVVVLSLPGQSLTIDSPYTYKHVPNVRDSHSGIQPVPIHQQNLINSEFYHPQILNHPGPSEP